MTRRRTSADTLARCTQLPFRKALIHESAQWIAEREWDRFATLTFEREVDEAAAAQAFEKYVRRLEQRSRGYVRYFAVAAKSPAFGRVHIHAVLGFNRLATVDACRKAWLAGYPRINRYQDRLDGNQYIADHVAIPGAEVLLRP